MAMTKTLEISGQPVTFRASAAIPRLYRLKFRRDIYADLKLLEKALSESDKEKSNLDLFSLEMFENIAFLMAKHAQPDQVPSSLEEWLDRFDTFSIYEVLPALVELWGLNLETQVESKKKFDQLIVK